MESESFIEYIIYNVFNRSCSGVDKPDEDDGIGKRLKITIFIWITVYKGWPHKNVKYYIANKKFSPNYSRSNPFWPS